MTREPKVAVRPAKYPTAPRRAKGEVGSEEREAWFYIDGEGIDAYCHAAPGVICSIRLSWRQVEAAMALRGPLPQRKEKGK